MTPNRTPPPFPSRPLRLYAALLSALPALTLSAPAQTGQAQGTLVVSVRVLPTCSSVIDSTSTVVQCPPGYPFTVTRTPLAEASMSAATLVPAHHVTQIVTIRY